jgi:hypothetical protein
MKITFLEGFVPLVKKFTPEGVDAYPLVKKVTSHEFEIENSPEGMRDKFKHVSKHAATGCALLKGNLTKKLVRESRSGHTNNDAAATNIVLDIDGVRPLGLNMSPPYNAEQVVEISEFFIDWLPECFKKVSYIAHASASLGTKEGVFSLHLDFMLAAPISLQLLKDYLLWLNFAIPQFEQELILTATGTGLRYKLDRTLADNSRIIYIGDPEFIDLPNPIPNSKDRLQLVEKKYHAVDVKDELIAIDRMRLQRLTRNKISYLRQSNGLVPRTEKMSVAQMNGHSVSVVTNPDNMYLAEAYERGPFVYYNINGGDSNGYYVYKSNPQVVYNFKNEPNFMFEAADLETYNAHLEKYGYTIENTPDKEDMPTGPDKDLKFPMVFRDKKTDQHYAAEYNPTTQQFVECNQIGTLKGAQNFMIGEKAIAPEIAPSIDYTFAPHDPRTIDMPKKFINRYVLSDILREPPPLEEKYQNTKYGFAGILADLCPTIHKMMMSIMGDGELEYEHFVNWLAYIVQKKSKTKVAWVCHGVPGTGKGMFIDKVMKPILGDQHALLKGPGDFEEKFNEFLRSALLVVIDEFNASDSKAKNSLINKLKNNITEENLTIRAMRSDQVTVPNFTSFMFFSNDEAPIPIQPGDRRYNVANVQKVPLFIKHPELKKNIFQLLAKEMPYFATFLITYELNELQAITALENDAKNNMRDAGSTAVDNFCQAIKEGNLEHFLSLLDITHASNYHESILPAKNLMHAYVRTLHKGEVEQILFVQDLKILFEALIGPIGSEAQLGKLLRRRGVESVRKRRNGHKISCVEIEWNIEDIKIPEVMEAYSINAEPAHLSGVYKIDD